MNEFADTGRGSLKPNAFKCNNKVQRNILSA